jgi:hypothetical protein
MFGLFSKKPEVSGAVTASCPVAPESVDRINMSKTRANGILEFDESVFGKLNTCYQQLKTAKSSEPRLNELFELIDNLRKKNESILTRSMNTIAAENFNLNIRRNEETVKNAIKGSALLTSAEKAVAIQYIYGVYRFVKHLNRLKSRANRKTARNTTSRAGGSRRRRNTRRHSGRK